SSASALRCTRALCWSIRMERVTPSLSITVETCTSLARVANSGRGSSQMRPARCRGCGPADAANPAAIHEGELVDGQHDGFGVRGLRRPVGAEHAVVDIVVDLRGEDVADEEGETERGREQPHVRRRTVPGQAKRKAHFSLSIARGIDGAGGPGSIPAPDRPGGLAY